jgi:hypothetical protein
MDYEPDLSYDEVERDHDEAYEPEYEQYDDDWYENQYDLGDQ